MENALALVNPAPHDPVAAACRRYNDACSSDGGTPASWTSIAEDLEAAALLVTGDSVNFLIDRAIDARGNARYAQRMIEHARQITRVIDIDPELSDAHRAVRETSLRRWS